MLFHPARFSIRRLPAFSTVDSTLKVARVRAHLRVLFDGKVQIIGGSNDGSMEIYDPLYEAIRRLCARACPKSIPAPGCRARFSLRKRARPCSITARAIHLFDRSGHTITELNGQALVLGGANSSGAVLSSSSVVASSSASITTDKMDYAPGETASDHWSWLPSRRNCPAEDSRRSTHAAGKRLRRRRGC